jgi:two-component system OmpR family response regulator
VDDRDDERAVVAAVLRHAGFEVLAAADGRAALRALRARTVQLVLLEAHLLDRGPPDLVARLQAQGPHLHVIVLTDGLTEPRLIEQAQRADGHIARPITTETLIVHLIELLRRRVAGGDRPRPPTA